jgi:hypothetical protein
MVAAIAGGHGLERRDRARTFLHPAPEQHAEGPAPGKAQMRELEEAQPDRQVQTRTHQQDHEGGAPDDPVEPVVEHQESVDHEIPPVDPVCG